MKKRRTIAIFCVVLAAFSMLAACANKEDGRNRLLGMDI